MKKKLECVVTGGAGFIGSCLAGRLVGEGHRVVVLDNLCTGNIANVPKDSDFIYFDISNPNNYYKIAKLKPDVMFHIAGQSSGEISFENPFHDLEVNTKGTVLLLDHCLKNGVKRFFYTSSMSVYGDRRKKVDETETPDPISFYGASKLASEKYISIYSKNGIDFTVFRPFNVYGPLQNMANMKQGMVSIFMAYLLKGQPVHVKGSLERYRDFVYIDDVVDCFMKCLASEKAVNRIYNLATGKKTTVGKLIEMMFAAAGKPGYPVKVAGSTPGDTFGIFGDNKRVCDDTGWKPSTGLADGLKKMYGHYAGTGKRS